MSVIRVNKTSNYTVMSNQHFKEKKMSLKAKGLLSLMLSLPDEWDYSIAGLVTLSSDGETSVRNTLQELENFGYLIRKRIYENGKIIDWEYNIFEEKQVVEKLDVENQQLGFQVVENKDNKVNSNKVKKKESKKELNKDINTKFDFGKSTESKQSLYSKCLADINSRNYNEILKTALIDYLNVRLQIKDKPLYANSWKGLLNKLEREFDEKDRLQVVYQSIERGYASFFPVNKGKSNSQLDKPWEDGVTCKKMTKQEEQEYQKWLAEQRAKGVKVDF